MPSYLAAWLFFLGVPVGALPLLMGFELTGGGRRPLAFALRRVAAVLPVAALLVVPVLLATRRLYAWTAHRPATGLSAAWFTPGGFVLRAIVYLVIWSLLALVFMRPPRPGGSGPRRALAGLGLILHLAIGTLAATDWALSLDPGLNASSIGLLLILSQCGVALSAALLLAAARGDEAALRDGAGLLLALLGAWAFVQFTQYLIVWSADLPPEIGWYQRRAAGLGRGAAWWALALTLLPAFVLLPRRTAGRPAAVAAMAALVLMLHLGETLWLVTPAARGHFAVRGGDVLLMVGMGGVVAGCTLALAGGGTRRRRQEGPLAPA